MTAKNAVARANALLPCSFSQEEQYRWLETLDGQLAEETSQTAPVLPYGDDTVLLIAAPWDELYLHYLQAKALYHLGEYDRYQNAMAQYNGAYLAYVAARTRQGTPNPAPLLRY